MKLCPVCQRCYEDADIRCLQDETALVASRPGSRMIADKYRLDLILGRGGMGAVYVGTHLDLDRRVAIKLLLSDFTADADAMERFRREARAAARLNHPNVADTFDYGVLPDGGAYIIMELVEGQTLRQYMDVAGAMNFAEAAEIGRQVSNGIDAAHRSGIVHRDLKPSNIILTLDHEGQLQAKVVDFGVAKLREYSTTGGGLTSSGSLIGTPRYMSPEQCSGHKIDARSDIYSLGVILYEMIAGQPPFDAPSATAIAIKHIQQPPPSLTEFRKDAPAALDDFLRQALDKDPEKRPQSAAEFGRRLSAVTAIAASVPTEAVISEQLQRPEVHSEFSKGNRKRETDAFTGPATGRGGHPTAEFSSSGLSQDDDPSVQGYLAPAESMTRPVENIQEPSPAKIAEAEHRQDISFKAPATVEMEKPFSPPTKESSNRRGLFIFAISAFAVGLLATILWLALRSPSSDESVSSNQPAQLPQSPAGGVTASSNSRSNEQETSQNVNPADERSQLKLALNEWISSTNARDINKQMSFYAPTLNVFYLKRNIRQAAVRAEKARTYTLYQTINVRAGEPEIQISEDGQMATMRFRKSWNFTGAAPESGEVLQELRWRKTPDGWKITSERDIEVIRVTR